MIGLFAIWLVSRLIQNKLSDRLQPHIQVLLNKLVWYGGLLLLGFTVLSELHIDVTALLGAAGVIGVAVGFASQTSISNIISGIFLVVEHPFKVGDYIEVGSMAGKVQTVDLLAVRLRTSNGCLVRVPNETLIKSSVINKTFYRSRRLTFIAMVKRDQDIAKVIEITNSVLAELDVVKKDPVASVSFNGTSMWTIDLCIQPWVDSRKVISSTAAIIEALYAKYKEEKLDVSVEAH